MEGTEDGPGSALQWEMAASPAWMLATEDRAEPDLCGWQPALSNGGVILGQASHFVKKNFLIREVFSREEGG